MAEENWSKRNGALQVEKQTGYQNKKRFIIKPVTSKQKGKLNKANKAKKNKSILETCKNIVKKARKQIIKNKTKKIIRSNVGKNISTPKCHQNEMPQLQFDQSNLTAYAQQSYVAATNQSIVPTNSVAFAPTPTSYNQDVVDNSACIDAPVYTMLSTVDFNQDLISSQSIQQIEEASLQADLAP